jgi:copper chaperone CopZ
MTHTYKVTGMTCGGCEASVKKKLEALPEVSEATASHLNQTATITTSRPLTTVQLQQALGGPQSKYIVSENGSTKTNGLYTSSTAATSTDEPDTRSWLETYRPILLVFVYISGITLLIQTLQPGFDMFEWMRHFMAGFFLVFSFFKLLNLRDFAASYAMYDVVAKKVPAWGYIYAFLELALGIAFLLDYNLLVTNIVTLVVMSVSIIGVLQSVLNQRKIRCACLGAVFNLPMSTVTIIEDGLMIAMSGWMVWQLA